MTSTTVPRTSNRTRVSVDTYDYLHVDGQFREHTLEMRGEGRLQIIHHDGTSSGWHGRWWWENARRFAQEVLYVQVDFAGRDSHAKTICFRPFMQRTTAPTFLQGTCRGLPHCVVVWSNFRWEWIDTAEKLVECSKCDFTGHPSQPDPRMSVRYASVCEADEDADVNLLLANDMKVASTR